MTTQTRTDNQFYIRLVCPTPLQKDSVVRFYKFVQAHTPSGILSSIQVERPGYGLDTVRLIHKTGDSGLPVYEIPLTRNLTDSENDSLQYAFRALSEEGQKLETSTPNIPLARYLPDSKPQLEPDVFETFCETLAKYQHSNWYSEKVEAGWRYGLDFDNHAKTSPLLRPWHDLPAHYQRIDKKLPTQILQLLENMGYVVVPKTELKKLKKK